MEASGELATDTLTTHAYLPKATVATSRRPLLLLYSFHYISAAATYYTRKLGHCVQTSTIHCLKSAYQDEIGKIRVSGSGKPLDSFRYKKQGRPVFLGEKVDGMVKA